MGRRKQHEDVFVLGDELLAAEASRPDPVEPGEDQEPDGHSQPSGLGPLPPPSSRLGRRAALIGLAGGAATTVAVVASSLGGSSGAPGLQTSSSRSALVQGPAPRAAVSPAPSTRPLPDYRRPESSHGGHVAPPRRSQIAEHEPEREPTPSQAPESSSLPISTPPAAPPIPAPTPSPPSPPPLEGGGGPVGTEHFGFER